jgi:hypothetical protein
MNIGHCIAMLAIAQLVFSGCAISAQPEPAPEVTESAQSSLVVEDDSGSSDPGDDIREHDSDEEADMTSGSGDEANMMPGRSDCVRGCVDDENICMRLLRNPAYCQQRYLACLARCRKLPRP